MGYLKIGVDYQTPNSTGIKHIRRGTASIIIVTTKGRPRRTFFNEEGEKYVVSARPETKLLYGGDETDVKKIVKHGAHGLTNMKKLDKNAEYGKKINKVLKEEICQDN